MANSPKQVETDPASTSSSTALKTQFYRKPLPSTCIDFASEDGKRIFTEAMSAGHMHAFFKLSAQFRTQDEPAYCGLTSLVMALNVLEIDPGRIWKGPWRWYHEDMLDCCTPLSVARDKGINMEQFVCLAKCNNLTVKEKSALEIISVDELRDEIKQAASRDDIVLVASYSRETLNQTGDGHFSPIAGYHEECDLVLILDTARFKYPPHWVPCRLLLDAMRTTDPDTGKLRGYVVLSASKKQDGFVCSQSSCSSTVDTTMNQATMNFGNQWSLYHEGRDLVLILDTARFKYPPHWVPVRLLLDAMRTIDSDTGRTRGYILLSASKNQASLLLFSPACSFAVNAEKGQRYQETMEFCKEWGLWLSSTEDDAHGQVPIVHQALKFLLDSQEKGHIFSQAFCLTMASIVKEDDGKKYVLESQKRNTGDIEKELSCVIQTLIKELESLMTFKAVSEFLLGKTNQEKEVFMNLIQHETSEKDPCKHGDDPKLGPPGFAMNAADAIKRSECCNKGACAPHADYVGMLPKKQKLSRETLTIGPEHAATIFLLAWPHSYFLSKVSSLSTLSCGFGNKDTAEICIGDSGSQSNRGKSTRGEILIKFVSSDLNKSKGQYVGSEVSTIRVKIREVMKYHNKESLQCCI